MHRTIKKESPGVTDYSTEFWVPGSFVMVTTPLNFGFQTLPYCWLPCCILSSSLSHNVDYEYVQLYMWRGSTVFYEDVTWQTVRVNFPEFYILTMCECVTVCECVWVSPAEKLNHWQQLVYQVTARPSGSSPRPPTIFAFPKENQAETSVGFYCNLIGQAEASAGVILNYIFNSQQKNEFQQHGLNLRNTHK